MGKNSSQSFFGRVISYVSGRVKVDRGSNDIITALHLSPPGELSAPVAGDMAVIMEVGGTGSFVASSYAGSSDTNLPGERVIRGRDSDGNITSSISLSSDGSIIITNINSGSIMMMSDGSVSINGVEISPSGAVSVPTSISSPSMLVGPTMSELAAHVHGGVASGGNSTGPLV